MSNPKSCQRKLGTLSLVSEETEGSRVLQRILAGTFELAPLLDKCQEVRARCFPDRGFIRLQVSEFYATWRAPLRRANTWRTPEDYDLIAFDTNAHGSYDGRGKTGAWFKTGTSYKRPSYDLCVAGHVPICWGHQGQEGNSFFASLPSEAVAAALAELETNYGSRPEKIEVRIQVVWLKPGDAMSKRAFMSCALA
jgi:hypothetical protein